MHDDYEGNHHQPETQVEREASMLLRELLTKNPLQEAPPDEDQLQLEHEGVYRIESLAASSLSCIAIVMDGKIIPIITLSASNAPQTPFEKMYLTTLAAKAILDNLLDVLLFSEQQRRNQQNRGRTDSVSDGEGGPLHV